MATTQVPVTQKPEIKSCWPEEINNDDVPQDRDSFELALFSIDTGKTVNDWKDVEAVLNNAGYSLVRNIKF